MSAQTSKKTPQSEYAARQDALRAEMKREGVDGFVVPVADEYQGEYPPVSARRVGWLTGFTGSAGAAVVLGADALDSGKTKGEADAKAAAVFVDGRYTLQARQQVDQSRYEQKDLMADPLAEWVASRLPKGAKLAYDPWMHTQAAVENMRKTLDKHGIELTATTHNLVDAVWKDRPPVPQEPVIVHGEEFAGEPSAAKRSRIGRLVKDNGADAAVLTDPASIAWLLNIRGGDVTHTPLALSFAVLHADGHVDWFIDEKKISDDIRAHVGAEVKIRPMEAMEAAMKELGKQGANVQYDPKRSASWFHKHLVDAGAHIVEKDDPCLLPKACKNPTEIEGMRQAHIRDGVALTKFLAWVDEEAHKRDVTELEVEQKLLAFRQQQQDFREPSFDTIAGSGAHGAIVHYRATEDSNKVLEKNSLFLLDSGGQYPDGTTDVTRTTVIGQPTDEQKKRFTQVLKGHAALACVAFPKGVSGQNLDVLARAALWADGEDYAHGTGHGVGAYLGVHEGPQSISLRSDVALQPGMILSNEPGYYKEGEYGIRIESLVAVKQKEGTGQNGSRPYYEFETLTMAPIDKRLIDPNMLSQAELDWLNGYHQQVFDTLAPHLDAKERTWLEDMTSPLAHDHSKEQTARAVQGRYTEAVSRSAGGAANSAAAIAK